MSFQFHFEFKTDFSLNCLCFCRIADNRRHFETDWRFEKPLRIWSFFCDLFALMWHNCHVWLVRFYFVFLFVRCSCFWHMRFVSEGGPSQDGQSFWNRLIEIAEWLTAHASWPLRVWLYLFDLFRGGRLFLFQVSIQQMSINGQTHQFVYNIWIIYERKIGFSATSFAVNHALKYFMQIAILLSISGRLVDRAVGWSFSFPIENIWFGKVHWMFVANAVLWFTEKGGFYEVRWSRNGSWAICNVEN